jgi:putative ABC transport system permease protein
MRLSDLLSLIFYNLGRRKARVSLTAIGVVIGTAAVVVLVSLGAGLQRSVTEQFGSIGDLTQIQVFPSFGEGGGPVFVGGGGPGIPATAQTLITDESLAQFAGLPGVTAVIPRDYLKTGAMLSVGRLEGFSQIIGVPAESLAELGLEAADGSLSVPRGAAVIGWQVPAQFFDPRIRPGQSPPPPPELLNRQIKLTLTRTASDGAEVRKVLQIRVVGLIAETLQEPDYSIYLNLGEVTSLNEWALGRRINRSRDGYDNVTVKVGDVDQAVPVTDQIVAMGYQAFTPQQFLEGINTTFLILQAVFGGVGAIALLVAAIGIANTMTMAILERTREIGLMKAVGATNRDVLSVFLGEAAGIGFVGGLGGVGLGWALAQAINFVAVAFFAQQAAGSGGGGGPPPPTVIVYTPLWLPIFALLFATLVGLLSGLYPALRAATLVPVNALKYE